MSDLASNESSNMSVPETNKKPMGTLLEGVSIGSVYLLEIEDLRTKFPSAGVQNRMQMRRVTPHDHPPLLRWSHASLTSQATGDEGTAAVAAATTAGSNKPQNYNKIIGDRECILGELQQDPASGAYTATTFLRAGPRARLHFDPSSVSAAIVTCGGLCPGLNNVVREITNTLHALYGIGGDVYGIQGGYRGFLKEGGMPPIVLTPALVEDIHHQGGTCLGSSRGGFDLDMILAFLRERKVNQLYVIGGDGTHRGAFRIHEECVKVGLNVAVAGIPKTIDNDVDYIDFSFGFRSAVEAACASIRVAKTEAVCNLPNGVGIVKLMGRSAGFIAAHATMASSDVDLCLVPEVPVVLEGENGCLPYLMRRVKQQGFAVVVVAEGAGEEVLGTSAETDASGNKKLPAIGEFMKKAIGEYFERNGQTATVKYIDPSYMVRSVPANAADSVYCMQLAQNAVHGAMAGYTGFSVGLVNNRTVYLPIPTLVATSPRSMNPHGRTWERVLGLTGQPNTVEANRSKQTASRHAPVLK